MNNNPPNSLPQEPISAHYSAPPIGTAAVWPPPPAGGYVPPAWRAFKFVYKRLEGNLSDLREGAVAADPGGIYLSGKAQPRAEILQPVTVGLFFISGFFALIAYCIMRYSCLQSVNMQVPWRSVRRVVSVAKHRTVCIVFDAPNYAGAIKTFCLAFSLEPGEFDAFLETARHYAPDRTLEGKLKPGSSLILRILVWFILFLMLVIFGFAVNEWLHPSASGAGGASLLCPMFIHAFS